jgi:hypothetical protein
MKNLIISPLDAYRHKIYHDLMMEFSLKIFLEGCVAYLLGTVIFDVCHYVLHRLAKSKNVFLKNLSQRHMIHHRFFYPHLKINPALRKQNLLSHVLPEYCVHMMSISLCFLFFHPLAVSMALIFETVLFLYVCYSQGMDAHHQPITQLISPRGGIFVTKNYHALHHIYPHQYYSSMIKIFDYLFGTGAQLKGKRITMTGASGALGKHMKVLLEKEGALVKTFKYGKDYTYDNYDLLKTTLKETDILFLCHGSKYDNAMLANCESFIKIIELFKAERTPHIVPPEIWGVGSEIECHPCFGIKKLKVYADSKRKYAKTAQQYFHDKNIHYRHLVHSAFMSPMGPGLMSAKFAATVTLFLIKRGFKYIPVTYTGIAWINYFRFFFLKRTRPNPPTNA